MRKTFAFLQMALRSHPCDVAVAQICRSQAGLARMSAEGILPMTLNTFKRYADETVSGGFAAIDSLRLAVLKHAAVPALGENVEQVDLYDQMMRIRAIQTRAYSELLVLAKEFAQGDRHMLRRYNEHNELYRQYFGPSPSKKA